MTTSCQVGTKQIKDDPPEPCQVEVYAKSAQNDLWNIKNGSDPPIKRADETTYIYFNRIRKKSDFPLRSKLLFADCPALRFTARGHP